MKFSLKKESEVFCRVNTIALFYFRLEKDYMLFEFMDFFFNIHFNLQ